MCSVFITILNVSNIDKDKFTNIWNHVTREIQLFLRPKETMESHDITVNQKPSDQDIFTIEFIVFVVNTFCIDAIHETIFNNQDRNARIVFYIPLIISKPPTQYQENLFQAPFYEISPKNKFAFVATMDTFSKRLKEALEAHGLILSRLLCFLLASIFL